MLVFNFISFSFLFVLFIVTGNVTCNSTSVGRSVGNPFAFSMRIACSAPARLPATGLPCIRPCFFLSLDTKNEKWHTRPASLRFEPLVFTCADKFEFPLTIFRFCAAFYGGKLYFLDFDHSLTMLITQCP